MRYRICDCLAVGVACVCFTLVGCGVDKKPGNPAPVANAGHDDHPSEGPHHGELIELGKEEYHAELVHDDATHTITVYLLDSAAKAAVPIDAKELVLNIVAAGKPQQFTLPARPESKDPAGQSSCFTLTDEVLCEAMDVKGTTGRLNVEINGKAFVGKIAQHEHDEHKK